MRDEGTSLTDAKDQARAAGQQARAAFEGAAPRGDESGSAPPPPPPPASPPSTPPVAPPPPDPPASEPPSETT